MQDLTKVRKCRWIVFFSGRGIPRLVYAGLFWSRFVVS